MPGDVHLVCRDCQKPFTFSQVERDYYVRRGFTNQPLRCPSCRANRRRKQLGLAPVEMHEVTCASCGAATVVPFVPRGSRPVYCSLCYESLRQSQGGGPSVPAQATL
ncbi:MAG: zinc-ribbon domain containing protein [Chloroflexi bacterium]|nr:zinc-ribbon domain containing protein [Chloroflexota bacterium]